ncbi:hypothetical protein [Brevundimonas sp.]|uniref:hypothetical protein n=1 Tax=Brevundimonas sp. TaxID=1871086 RepID=UPI0028993810|nr:hypothetical protein [Brevundimonas sp.]
MARLTEQQIIEMAERREKGWSYGRLARTYGVTPGAVHYQCLRQGARSPNETGLQAQANPRVIHLANGRVQRRFSATEDQKMQSLALAGQGPSAIARSLDRPLTSVRMRLMALALRQGEA